MFDDSALQPKGSVPPNLPTAEPEDIFGQTDVSADETVPISEPNPLEKNPDSFGVAPEFSTPKTAIQAGILKPKSSPESLDMVPSQPPDVPPKIITPPEEQMDYPMKEPLLSRGLAIGLIAGVGVLFLGFAGWYVYRVFIQDTNEVDIQPTQTAEQTGETSGQPVPSGEQNTQPPAPQFSVDEQILFGEPIDSDSDGISNGDEKDVGTDPLHWDSDSDGLSDGDAEFA